MYCELCLNFDKTKDPGANDCVVEHLEKIKIHFDHIKKKSEKLKLENDTLKKTIKALEENLKRKNCSPRKKRKTNSLPDDENENEENKSPLSLSLLSSSSSSFVLKEPDELNSDLNKAMDITNIEWSESSFSSTDNKKQEEKTENAFFKSPQKNIFSPLNNDKPSSLRKFLSAQSSSPLSTTPLPRRLKLPTTIKEKSNENRKVEASSRWITSKESKISNSPICKLSDGMSFIQPHKTISDVTNLSVGNKKDGGLIDISMRKTPPLSSRKDLSLTKPSLKLRQTRLLFDITANEQNKKTSDTNETFCNEIIHPSPTSWSIEEGVKVKKSLSNFSRKKCDINLFSFSSPTKKSIKSEHSTLLPLSRENVLSKRKKSKDGEDSSSSELESEFKENSNKNDVQDQNKDSSSVIALLDDQVDDVIIIDSATDVDYNKIDAKDLINEMTIKSYDDVTPTFCDFSNKKNITKNKQEQANKQEEKNIENREILNKTKDEILKTACLECREYFKYVGRNLTADELRLRLRNCKHKFIDVNPTPEGFWNPLFPSFPEGDPRNETIIDDCFLINNCEDDSKNETMIDEHFLIKKENETKKGKQFT